MRATQPNGAGAFVRATGNRFGLVLQSGTSGAQPTLGEGNAFEGNTEQDRSTAGDLPVPSAAPPLPSAQRSERRLSVES